VSFRSLLNLVGVVTRKVDAIVDSVSIAASITVDRQPAEECYLDVTVSGTCGTGTVSITGLVSAVPTTEDIPFTAAKTIRTSNAFTSVTGISTTGLLATGTILVECRTLEGNPVYQTITVYSNLKCRLSRPDFSRYRIEPGETERNIFRLFSLNELLRGDMITIDSTVYSANARSRSLYAMKASPHHYECEVRLITGN